MIRWFSNAKARAAYAKLRSAEDRELDLFSGLAIVEFWLVSVGVVLLFVWPWIGGGVLALAVVLAVLAFVVSG